MNGEYIDLNIEATSELEIQCDTEIVYRGKRFIVTEGTECGNCEAWSLGLCRISRCSADERTDGKNILYKEIY